MIIRGRQRPVTPQPVRGNRVVAIPGRKLTPQEKAREKMADKAMGMYFKLACGHYGTREDDIKFAKWRPNTKMHYCEKDGWIELHKEPKPKNLECPNCGHMNYVSTVECENCQKFLF